MYAAYMHVCESMYDACMDCEKTFVLHVYMCERACVPHVLMRVYKREHVSMFMCERACVLCAQMCVRASVLHVFMCVRTCVLCACMCVTARMMHAWMCEKARVLHCY